MSNPRFQPSEEDRNLVRVLASIGTPVEEIALVLENPKRKNKPLARKTVMRAFKDELKQGRARVKAFAVGKLFKLIQAEHPASIMFYLKTQCGWRETSVLEGPRGGPIPVALSGSVEVILPGNGRRNDGAGKPA